MVAKTPRREPSLFSYSYLFSNFFVWKKLHTEKKRVKIIQMSTTAAPRCARYASTSVRRKRTHHAWSQMSVRRNARAAMSSSSSLDPSPSVVVVDDDETSTTTTSSSSSSLLSSLVGKREGSVFWDSVLELSPRRRRGRASHGERRRQRWKRRWEKRRDGRKREHG